MTKKKCGKVHFLLHGSYSCERPKGHKGLHRKYAIKCPGGMPGFAFSDAEAEKSKLYREGD